MKKTLLLGVSLLSVLALAACSTSSKTTSSSTSSEASSSTVESSSSTTSSSSSTEASSTEASSVTLKESTVTYLSDAEIDAVSTIGDYKNAFQSLLDSYVSDFEEVIEQMPDAAKTGLDPYRQQLLETFEQQKATLDEQFAAIGDDSTELPAEGRDTLLSSLKEMRDSLKATMQTVREQAATLLQ